MIDPAALAVIPRESGVSSTLRLLGLIFALSELDHPPSRVMTRENDCRF
jgi:hypothetical protein